MNLIDQLRNQIRGRKKADSDILQAIAQGVKEELSSKYLLFEFIVNLRPTGWNSGWHVELTATLQASPEYVCRLVFKVIFKNDKCILHSGGMTGRIHEFVYEDPNMLNQLYQAISRLPFVPK